MSVDVGRGGADLHRSEHMPYKDPEFLRVAYWGREQTIQEIADVFGVGYDTISHFMDRNDIPKRGPGSGEGVRFGYSSSGEL